MEESEEIREEEEEEKVSQHDETDEEGSASGNLPADDSDHVQEEQRPDETVRETEHEESDLFYGYETESISLEDFEAIKSRNAFLSDENRLLRRSWGVVEKYAGTFDPCVTESTRRSTFSGRRGTRYSMFEVVDGSIVSRSDSRQSTTTSISDDVYPHLDLTVKIYLANEWLMELNSEQQDMEKYSDERMADLLARVEEAETERDGITPQMQDFNQNVKIDGKHPITNKVIAEIVDNYFHDSLREKEIAEERFTMQAADCKEKRNKITHLIQQKEKSLRLLRSVDVAKAEYEHSKSKGMCGKYEQQYFDFRARQNRLLQDTANLKRTLDEAEKELTELNELVIKNAISKDLYDKEKTAFLEEEKECEAIKKKIERNPCSKIFPPVLEYVEVQAHLDLLEKLVRTWRNKVEALEFASNFNSRQRK